ncbi:MAG: transglutaminase family protein [Luteolibacter sp.]|uniref:transglutaminase-like domain-containing protein n=1 Tax=Luteolibacter sp. TaxID=1962973 RepID=UPI003267387E
MIFRVSSNLIYTLNNPSTFFFAIKCIETGGQKIRAETFYTNPALESEDFSASVGMNRFTRIVTSAPGNLQVRYQADVETSISVVDVASLKADGPSSLTPEAVPFLFPSRYCQSDRLRQQAMDLFGHLSGSYAITAAICDWIFERVAYKSGSTNEQSSAVDTLEQRQGVCRDFAHLGIALCRSMNIPARYISCYSHLLNPTDFHAVFEVFIGGLWYVFDATRLAPLNGLVRIATGRDAADVSVCTIFGDPVLDSSEAISNSLDNQFTPMTTETLAAANQAIALL